MTTNELQLDPARTALVNVHWQQDIVTAQGAFAPFFAEAVQRHGVIDRTRILVEAARESGVPVIWARAAFRPGYPELVMNTGLSHAIKDLNALVEGSSGAQIIEELAPLDSEPVVSHPGTSAFPVTPLDSILRRLGIETVLFTGVATNITVEGTARDAVNLGYRAVIVSDACAAATDAAHEATLETFSLLGQTATVDEIRAALEAVAAQPVGSAS
ncbi:nicotinamidase-related amidase [Arthrobacter globiformis]|uniref:cysteine hydrolase family protein n=1 Tax=Arthrobacter globiformis TaxID=1665 RepID=UPI00277F8D8B|nr:cysteine hydrolase [Arthrobacter globiformis]MDQ1058114.1 nicotinamidase-related amidase [Arthrobacter globiformis]